MRELQRHDHPNIVVALAEDKTDFASERMIEYEELQTFADEQGPLCMGTSAKSAMIVNDIFLAIKVRL